MIKLLVEFDSLINSLLIFLKEIFLKKISKNSKKPTMIEINQGIIKVIFQLKNFNKKPAKKAPEPIPIPPKTPFIPSALPFFLVELTTHEIPTG